MKTMMVTGHRPSKLLGGYGKFSPGRIALRDKMAEILRSEKPDLAISGMALGVDQDFAETALVLGIPLLAAVPFKGQEATWPIESRILYHDLLKGAHRIVIVSEGGYSAEKMMKRNAWMVNQLTERDDACLAVYDGSKGGTENCVRYAQSRGKRMIFLDPRSLVPETVADDTPY